MIDEILVNNDQKRIVAARFLTHKLWEFFAYIGPDQALVSVLAEQLLDNQMNVGRLMRAILLRDEFYSASARQGLVRVTTRVDRRRRLPRQHERRRRRADRP